MASTHRASDKILARCCECSLKALVELQQDVMAQVDDVPRGRELIRTIDAIGSFRFPRDWDAVSPARLADVRDNAKFLAQINQRATT